jgi:anaerobic nitric oxide reductase transcription regulator
LNAYPIAIAPLRERREDIPILASHYCEVLQRKFGTAPVRLDVSAKDSLKRAFWPGNVRELKNVLSRAILNAHHRSTASKVLLLTSRDIDPLLAPDEGVHRADAREKGEEGPPNHRSLKDATKSFQRSFILSSLHQHGNNWARTAKSLGMDRSNLHHLAKRLGLIE